MKEKSFTLIELLAVIFIIGILAGLLVPAIGRVRRDAQIKAQQVEIRAIEIALESFYSDYLQYPPDPNAASSLIEVRDASANEPWNPDSDPSSPSRLAPTGGGSMDLASEVFYYYLCSKWSRTDTTLPLANRYRILLQINPATTTLEYVDVRGDNGSPYLAPKSDRIGDTDGDGLLELLDIWRIPYRYWNNADGITCETGANDPEDSPVCYQDVGRRPDGAVQDAGDVWHHPHNEYNFDIYSLGLNRADNLGFNDISFGDAGNDDDDNDTVDDEDDVNNY